jgi:hypothetical protein
MCHLKHADCQKALSTYATQGSWKDWYRTPVIYDKLKRGPVFQETTEHTIPRKSLVEEIRRLITPLERSSLYSLITGDYGTGKTNLIELAVNGMDDPRGIVYIDMPSEHSSEIDVVKKMQDALGWSPDQSTDSRERNYNSPFQRVLLEANGLVAVSLHEALKGFSRLAIKYKQQYGRIPVLIIDNVDRLTQKHQGLLDLFQDYAKDASDKGRAAVVFVFSGDQVRRRMMSESIIFIVFACYVLIKYYRE